MEASTRTPFQVDDTVRLVCPSITLIGAVERTYYNINSHDYVRDCLIVSHIPVPSDVIQQFVSTGIPPKGFLFVQWAQLEYGWSLVAEEHVTLLDRLLNIGETVKRRQHEAIAGTVVSVKSQYGLHPIFPVADQGEEGSENPWLFGAGREKPILVSGEEIKRAEDFENGDHIISQDWLGVVENADPDVIMLLPNQTVVQVHSPWELEIVVPLFGGPVVSFPDTDQTTRPDMAAVQRSEITTMVPEAFSRGQLVMTNHKNLQKGRWLKGEHDPNYPPQGYILDVRTRRMDIQWLCPNAFNPNASASSSYNVRPYDNLGSFREAREIRRLKELVPYDHDRRPTSSTSTASTVSTSGGHRVGDQVRFRYPKSRSAELPETVQEHWIPREKSFGFEVNEYRIISSAQDATVLWQDGSTTTLRSTELIPSMLPDTDLCPGDLVTAKEGTKQIPVGGSVEDAVDFNEMIFFEREYILKPAKVGVVQSVNAAERLASVRWFVKPDIELHQYGRVLKVTSTFGPIGDDVEDVSSYEIMSHSALIRRRRDMVLIPPAASRRKLIFDEENLLANAAVGVGPTTLTNVRLHQTSLPALLQMIAMSHTSEVYSVNAVPAQRKAKARSRVCDWIGEIVDVGLDGMVTVRLAALGECRDVKLSHEQILFTIDGEAEYYDSPDDLGDPMNLDDPLLSHPPFINTSDEESDGNEDLRSEYESAIDEVVEYDGGVRVDNDSGDEMWSTDDEDGDSANTSIGKETEKEEAAESHGFVVPGQFPLDEPPAGVTPDEPRADIAPSEPTVEYHEEVKQTSQKSVLYNILGEEGPPSFQILGDLPPADQYGSTDPPSTSPTFLKRIRREHNTLHNALPPGEIYVRSYETRLDLLRCLLIGPKDSPYEYAPFVIDLRLGPEFPHKPPTAHFHSWTSGLGRINPNLYEEGKICLSLLGTWPGRSETEGWTESSSLLQILISLHALVLNARPFYNEAGFETYHEDQAYALESLQYSEKAFVMARGFVKHAILTPVFMLEDILAWLYMPATAYIDKLPGRPHGLLVTVIERTEKLIARSETTKERSITDLVDGEGKAGDDTTAFLQPLSQGAIVMLKKNMLALKELLGDGRRDGEFWMTRPR